MASLTLQGSTSGQITLATPAVAGTNTITLPAATGTLVTSESATISGNLTFTGTGNRILGDFSNATSSNRVLFQTSTTNGQTATGLLPNGTSTQSQFAVYNGSDPLNASQGRILSNASEFRIENFAVGTGTYLPMTFYTGGSERMRIDTSGNVGIGTSSPAASLSVVKQTTALSGTGNSYGIYMYPTSSGLTYIDAITGSTGNTSLGFRTYNNGTYNEMRIDSSGNVGIGTNSPGYKLQVYATSNSLQIESVVRNDQSGTGVAAIGFNVSSSASAETSSTKAGIGLVRTNPYGVGALAFYNNNTGSAGDFTTSDERMRIDSSGNVGIGTSSPAFRTEIVCSDNNGIQIKNSGGTTYGGMFVEASAMAYGTRSNTAMRFITNDTERMRLGASGGLAIGTTNIVTTFGLTLPNNGQIETNGGTVYSNSIYNSTTSAGASVSITGTAGYLQRSTSSAKYKTQIENLEPLRSKSIYEMRPVWYRSLCEMDRKDWSWYGLIAEEVAEIEPRLVHWGIPDENGKQEPEGVMYDRLTVLLLQEIQELKAELDALKGTK